jgi:hypothetical protein
VLPGDAEWDDLRPRFPDGLIGVRQAIVADIHRVQTSCGYAVPRMDLVEDRETLDRWARSKGPVRLDAYRRLKNTASIDGLTAPIAACWSAGEADA